MAGVFTVLGLGILIWLGFWQLDRHVWKTDLLARIDASMSLPPVPLVEITLFAENEFRRVCTSGEYLNDKELHMFSISVRGEGGYNIYTPFLTIEGTAIIINRGWVPTFKRDPATRPDGQLAGLQNICGAIRLDQTKGRFTPENDRAGGVWFYRDRTRMAKVMGLDVSALTFVEADEAKNPGGFPVGGQTKMNIPNNHLGYAFTWFGLALTLIGVFSAFVYFQRKK